MYPITNEVKALFESEQRKVLRITGTDKNGATISITDDNVIEDSFQIDRYACNGEKLEIGTAIAGQLTLKLENGNGQYDGIVFEGAELFVEVGIADWTQSSPTVTYIPCGYFTPDEQRRRLSTISITALDRMMRFDAVSLTKIPWTTRSGEVITTDSGEPIYFVKSIRFPCTIAQIVAQTATICNVPFTQDLSGFPNANISIQELPVPNKDLTYRTLIQWCAAIMGCNAWIDWTGSLRFSWYENTTDYVSTIDNRYSSDMYENDLTVTGVKYTTTGGIDIVEGTDDYALDITGNTLAGPIISTILSPLNTALNGFTYRPFTAAVVNAPYLWPMDIITFTDKDGNDHDSVLTNVCFGLNGTTALESKGMTYAINKAAQPKGFTREQAQLVNQAMEQVETNIDESLTQQEIFNRLTDNGAAQGMVLYNGQLYINASYIQSGTLTLGGMNNQNGMLRVLDASGNEVGIWDNSGINITKGNINLDSTGSIRVGFNTTNTQYVLFNTLGMKLVLNSGSKLYTSQITTHGGKYPNVPLGMLVCDYEDGNEKWVANISPGQIDIGHIQDNHYDYTFTYDLSGLYLSGPDGGFTFRTDQGTFYINADVTIKTPLGITSGGTGAINAADARENLEITPANIGAVDKDGDTIDGDLTINGDLAAENITSTNPLEVRYGGTGAINAADARENLEITPANIGAVDKDGDTIDGDLTINGDLAVNADNNIRLTSDYNVTIGDIDAKIVKRSDGTVYMQSSGNASVYVNNNGDALIQSYNGAAIIRLYSDGDITVNGTVKDKRILQAPYALPIPAAGSTSTMNISGLTSDHQLVRWNFSSSAENAPPADLEWNTYDGYFTITNNGGTTSESITPVFILPQQEGGE